MKKRPGQSAIGYVIMLAVILLFAALLGSGYGNTVNRRIEYPTLLQMIKNDEIKAVAVRGNNLVGLRRVSTVADADFPEKNYDFETTIGEDFIETAKQLTAELINKEALAASEAAGESTAETHIVKADDLSVSDLRFTLSYRANVVRPWWYDFIPYVVMMGLALLVFFLMMRSQPGIGGKMNNFTHSNARVQEASRNQVTFADVAGADEEKEELQEMVDFLRNPKSYTEVGARIPKGVLLVGPPGTGKTLLAKAVAGEAGVPFFSISGSDFVEMFVGVGASRVRDLFDQAKKTAPSIVFIDEIDAVGRHRGAGLGGGHDEREQTLNQLLVEMDGFEVNQGVIVMAATNRRDILDPALLRPGRFDRQVTVNYPDTDGRVAILKVHSRGKPLAPDVDLGNIAKRVPFATGAELENIMNEAAILAARAKQKQISQQMLVDAIARVQMGPEKKSHKVTESDRRMVAVHESGHAVVGHFLPGCDEVHLVTIVPRGQSAGHTLSLPGEEHDNMSRSAMMDSICMMLGGHASEEVILGEISTGSSSDLKRATELCRRMVTQFGMSDKLGVIYLGSDQEVFVGMEFGQSREYSEKTASLIDEEVKSLLDTCYRRAKETISAHREQFDLLVDKLLKEETIGRKEFLSLMDGTPEIAPGDTEAANEQEAPSTQPERVSLVKEDEQA